ncbi:MAG: hypothetical protein OGMRLDGQ_002339 [Candidatus Fervidibacter sp.]
MKLFHYLDEGLAIILVFIGIKMLLSEVYPIPISLSLGFVLLVLTVTIVLSLWAERRERTAALANPNHPPAMRSCPFSPFPSQGTYMGAKEVGVLLTSQLTSQRLTAIPVEPLPAFLPRFAAFV